MRACLIASVLLVAWPAAADATPSLVGARTLEQGRFGAHASVGFPYLSAKLLYGVLPAFDASVDFRVAWADVQRIGLNGRLRLLEGDTAFALRAGVNTWVARPDASRWIEITGETDYAGQLAAVLSYTTPRGTVLTLDGAVVFLGNTRPRTDPLAPPPGPVAFGANVALRTIAELPFDSGFVLTVEVGADLHTSGFDDAFAMPVFGVGCGWR